MFRSRFRPFRDLKCKKGPQKRVFQQILRRPMSCQLFSQTNFQFLRSAQFDVRSSDIESRIRFGPQKNGPLRARTRKIVVISSDIVDIVLKHVHTPQVELHPPETPGMVTWWQVNLLRTVVSCFVCFLKFPARFSNLRRCFQTRMLTPSVLDMVQL